MLRRVLNSTLSNGHSYIFIGYDKRIHRTAFDVDWSLTCIKKDMI